ncbi:type II toxin-antitoxin system RelE/ParE family toxin [Apilactobacillus micheneri]|uniref:type II toxin-antitoxin system RelE/ParE family toxin n=1 Tax=Apilactobacillus micheneri TaxID=1899430 RepID=UPI00112E52CE|nr:type II toxin-antitoxin system RelE/ParE family toxin [Apilactobacillus micheneri]TPR41266.1 type II toxin-antitoxin system RelE/ParE family toxin [Apilactobacillus micheneri]
MEDIIFNFYNWSEFKSFLDNLPSKDAAKLVSTIQNVEKYGVEIAKRQEWIKKLEKNLYEIRSKRSSNIQRSIYFKIEGNTCIITHGFTKKSQKTPRKEITKAKNRRSFYIKKYR